MGTEQHYLIHTHTFCVYWLPLFLCLQPCVIFIWFCICSFRNLDSPGISTSASTCCISPLTAEFSAEIPDLRVHLCYHLVFIWAAEDQSQAALVEWQHLCPHSSWLGSEVITAQLEQLVQHWGHASSAPDPVPAHEYNTQSTKAEDT